MARPSATTSIFYLLADRNAAFEILELFAGAQQGQAGIGAELFLRLRGVEVAVARSSRWFSSWGAC